MKRNQHIIATLLEEWFAAKNGNPHIWNDNPVGRLIMSEVKKRGNWKLAPRGDPKKGYRQMCRKLEGGDGTSW